MPFAQRRISQLRCGPGWVGLSIGHRRWFALSQDQPSEEHHQTENGRDDTNNHDELAGKRKLEVVNEAKYGREEHDKGAEQKIGHDIADEDMKRRRDGHESLVVAVVADLTLTTRAREG